jgi:D-alanyl-D-alanine carboxypeptidase/D-alanyl-D-alanine-endopeptidase (penicillin-binding protein 4)
MSPRRITVLLALALALLPAAEASAQSQGELPGKLRSAMRGAGSASGAYVVNADTGTPVFRYRYDRPRILASNTKLFTTAAALAQFGVEGRLSTEVRGTGVLEEDGVFRGSLYLVGGGDPSFGSRRFSRRSYGGGGTVEGLAALIDKAGIKRVTGRIYGDESRFDSRRGGPESGFRISPYVGPLSGLAYNRGLSSESGRGYQANPPAFAAARLDSALARRDISVAGAPRAGEAPADARVLAAVESPTMTRLAALTNKPSDNFFAEMLVKDLAARPGVRGTTAAGARLAARFARRIGGRPARLVDGSGLSRADRASPYRVTRLLLAMRKRDEFDPFFASLSIAGRDGTLGPRMRGGPARTRCRGKTGTLSNVSAVSGYCRARSGETYAFSILMNGVNPFGARAIQDRMLQAIAGVR